VGKSDEGEDGRGGLATEPDEGLDVGSRLGCASGANQEDGSIVMGIAEGRIGREGRRKIGDGCGGPSRFGM
jgi:hypothetical protein